MSLRLMGLMGRLHGIEVLEGSRLQGVRLAEIVAVGVLDAHVGIVDVGNQRGGQVHAGRYAGWRLGGSCRYGNSYGGSLGGSLRSLLLFAAPLGTAVREPNLE